MRYAATPQDEDDKMHDRQQQAAYHALDVLKSVPPGVGGESLRELAGEVLTKYLSEYK